jgi:hypothetical protein
MRFPFRQARYAVLCAELQCALRLTGAGIRLPLGEKTMLEFAAANAVQDDRLASIAGDWRVLFGLTSAF